MLISALLVTKVARIPLQAVAGVQRTRLETGKSSCAMHAEMGGEIGGILCCGTCELAGLHLHSRAAWRNSGEFAGGIASIPPGVCTDRAMAICHMQSFSTTIRKFQLGGGSCMIALIHLLVLLIRSLHSLRVQAPPGAVRR